MDRFSAVGAEIAGPAGRLPLAPCLWLVQLGVNVGVKYRLLLVVSWRRVHHGLKAQWQDEFYSNLGGWMAGDLPC